MNVLETLLNSQDGSLVKQLAQNFGIGENDARGAVSKMVPALSRGMQKNMASENGLSSLMGALQSGKHQGYLDDPQALNRQETVSDGNAILGHLLGSKDVSRNVAGHAAAETGLDAGILKKMLPMVAAAMMGSVEKQASGGGMGDMLGSALKQGSSSLGSAGSSSPLGGLASFLDADKDGSVADDLLGLAKKFF